MTITALVSIIKPMPNQTIVIIAVSSIHDDDEDGHENKIDRPTVCCCAKIQEIKRKYNANYDTAR